MINAHMQFDSNCNWEQIFMTGSNDDDISGASAKSSVTKGSGILEGPWSLLCTSCAQHYLFIVAV